MDELSDSDSDVTRLNSTSFVTSLPMSKATKEGRKEAACGDLYLPLMADNVVLVQQRVGHTANTL